MAANRIAIVLLADVGTPGAMARMANALVTAREFHEAGDEVKLIFDGAGTRWVGQLARADHKYHGTFESLRGVIAGVCQYCANAYGVADEVKTAGPAPPSNAILICRSTATMRLGQPP